MKKEDFYKGQTVWIHLTGNAGRGRKKEERIEEWEVVSVGKKYITAKQKNGSRNARFNIEKDFRQVTDYLDDYELYLTKEDILHDIWREKTIKYVEKFTRWDTFYLIKLSDEDLKTVENIFKKYDNGGLIE